MEMCGDQLRICMWILGLKGVMDSSVSNIETCIADSYGDPRYQTSYNSNLYHKLDTYTMWTLGFTALVSSLVSILHII